MAFTQQTPIGTPDFNLITKTLAGLQPDSALQNYAMLHKNNPYILSLAKSESDRRKTLRTAAQGNPGQMPTVADREIAGMAPAPMMAQQQLPENQGIAQIPTPNIQRMADGGIAGYADDEEGMATGGMGGMFNFAQQSEPVVRMSGGGHVPRYQGNTTDGSVVGGIPGFQAVQPRAEFTQEGSPENMTPFERLSGYMKDKQKQATLTEIAYRINKGIATPDEIRLYNDERIKAGDKAATEAKYPSNTATRVKDFSNVKPGFEKMPVDAAAAPPPPPPGAKSTGGVKDLFPAPPKLDTSFKPVAAPTIEDAKTLGNKFTNLDARTNTINSQVAQKRSDITTAAENRVAALQAFNEKQGPAYAGYEKLLQKEELQDATDKNKAGLMSLMKGFLAMAAGESPNAATNIAKGAMVGLGDYGDALKDFKKSAKERNKEMQNIENARRAEARGNFDKAEMYEYQADQNRIAATDAGIAAISKVTDTSAAISAGLHSDALKLASDQNIAVLKERGLNARSIYEQTSQNTRSLLPTGDARTAMMLGSGKTDAERLKSGMGVLQELSADKTGMAAFKILGEINAKYANDPMFKPLTLADLTAFQRDYQRNMQAGPKNVSDKPTGKAFD